MIVLARSPCAAAAMYRVTSYRVTSIIVSIRVPPSTRVMREAFETPETFG